MSQAHQHLALSAVKPGMILSDDLLDNQGQVLLASGTVLTERTIALLPSHGVDMLAVACPADAPAALDPAALSARLDYLFRHNDPDNPADWATGVLRRYMLDYRLEREIAP